MRDSTSRPIHSISILPLALAAALTACGGGAADIEGVYEVSRHTLNDTECTAEGPEVTTFTHFSLRADNFLGEDFLSFGECTGPDLDTCDDFGLFSAFLDIDGRWQQQVSTSSFGGSCTLGYNLGVIDEGGDGSLRIELRAYSELDDTLTDEQCDTDEAEARGDTMPCDRYEVVEGTLVQ